MPYRHLPPEASRPFLLRRRPTFAIRASVATACMLGGAIVLLGTNVVALMAALAVALALVGRSANGDATQRRAAAHLRSLGRFRLALRRARRLRREVRRRRSVQLERRSADGDP